MIVGVAAGVGDLLAVDFGSGSSGCQPGALHQGTELLSGRVDRKPDEPAVGCRPHPVPAQNTDRASDLLCNPPRIFDRGAPDVHETEDDLLVVWKSGEELGLDAAAGALEGELSSPTRTDVGEHAGEGFDPFRVPHRRSLADGRKPRQK